MGSTLVAAASAGWGNAGVGYAGLGAGIAAAPGYLGGYGYAHPYDYAGQVYPAAEPYLHLEVPAEAYIHEEVAAEPYVHEEIAAEPYIHIEPIAAPVAIAAAP